MSGVYLLELTCSRENKKRNHLELKSSVALCRNFKFEELKCRWGSILIACTYVSSSTSPMSEEYTFPAVPAWKIVSCGIPWHYLEGIFSVIAHCALCEGPTAIPSVDIKTKAINIAVIMDHNSIVGALLKWHIPGRGLLCASVFCLMALVNSMKIQLDFLVLWL